MSIVRSFVALSLAVLVASSSLRANQQHIVAPGQVAAAVADRVAQQDSDRAAVSEALKRPEVREAAARMGVNLSTVEARISTLAGDDLARAADAARQVNDDLVGGASTITISTTTIIIVLLLVILILVAD